MWIVSSLQIPNLDGYIQFKIMNTNSEAYYILIVNITGVKFCQLGWYIYGGMITDGKTEFVGESPQCTRPEFVHILLCTM